MKKTNLLKTLILSLLSCILGCFFLACDEKEGEGENNNYLNLNKSQVSVMLGETFMLQADYNVREGETLTFTSKDANVATVNGDGVLTAIAVGSTEVVVRYGEDEKTCLVKVETQGVVPYLEMVSDVDEGVTCYVGNGASLGAFVSFNSKTYKDAIFTYDSSKDSVAEVTNEGILTAKASGETEITVNAAWRGFNLTKTIAVSVVDQVECCINGGSVLEFNLGTIAEFRDQTFIVEQPIEITATANGEAITDYDVSVLNEEVFKYEGGKVIAVNAGTSALQIDFTVGETPYTYTYEVSVKKPRFTYEKTVYLDSETPFPCATVFGEEGSLIKVDDANGALDLTLESDVIGGLPVNEQNPTAQSLVVETAKLVCDVQVMPCTAVVDSWAEFKTVFPAATDYTGYYVLSQNINANGERTNWNGSSKGLKGIFDGRGYSISNFECNNYGLFGAISGTIKNVAFKDVKVRAGSSNYMAIGCVSGSGSKFSLQNVYLGFAEGTYDNTSSNFTVFGRVTGAIQNYMNNVVVDISKVTLNNYYKVGFYATDLNGIWDNDGAETLYSRTNQRWTDIYLVSKAPLMYFSRANDVRILDAANRATDTSYFNPADSSKEVQRLTFDGVHRYDTLSDFATAIASADTSAFTESGYWKIDSASGLLWK